MNLVSKNLIKNNIKNLVFMPDSLGMNFINVLLNTDVNLIQTVNETDAVTISGGLNLTGEITICMMENSGLRSACELIVRLEKLNHIFNFYIINQRGEIGEENWWGISHNIITNDIVEKLNFKHCTVNSITELDIALKHATQSFKTEQCSVALFLTRQFIESIKEGGLYVDNE